MKVTVSIPDGVIGIFHWLNLSSRTMVDSAANGNDYRRYLLGGGGRKGGRCLGLTNLPSSCDERLEILGMSTSLSPKDLSGL
jgi:hypothetical protein